MSSPREWLLSQTLSSNGDAVRAVCVLPGNDRTSFRLVTGTQNGSMWEYAVPSGDLAPLTAQQQSHCITALLAPHSVCGNIYAIGCKDSLVRLYDSATHELKATLKGHDKAVTSLSWYHNNNEYFLLSGSWDGTARIWSLSQNSCVCCLEGHENTVSVCALPEGKIATGSAGVAQGNVISHHSIRIWEIGTNLGVMQARLLQTVRNDHDGPIRDVCLVGAFLASCSNDGTVKLRDAASGTCLSTLTFIGSTDHPPMLLSLCALTTDGALCAASAEDGNVVVFDEAGSHVIMHPGCVWKVAALPNGDLCTCCQDGQLRIFTLAKDRVAPQSIRDKFAEEIRESTAKRSSGPSQDEVAKLPKWEECAFQQGRSDGQVQLFQKNGTAIAAQWSAASRTWIEVGQVMGTNEQAGQINGVTYDHVLPIEVDAPGGGGAVNKLQIGYNNGENPFVVAQRFIDEHMLPQYHLSEIADYIQQRVGTQAPTIGGTQNSASSPTIDMGNSLPTPMEVSYKHIPMQGYKFFDSGTDSLSKVLGKIKEFNSTSSSPLTDMHLSHLESLCQTLGATNRYHASQVDNSELHVLTHIIGKWDVKTCFPALDLARLAVLHPHAARRDNSDYWKQVLELAMKKCKEATTSVAVAMLTLRLFSNCFRAGGGPQQAVVALGDRVVECASSYISSPDNKSVRLGLSTLMLNAASYIKSSDTSSGIFAKLLGLVGSMLTAGSNKYESEATVRALVALGTLLLVKKDSSQPWSSLVEQAAITHGSKAQAVAKEIQSLIN